MKMYRVFAINPGSTSTKIALFEGENRVFFQNVTHDAEKLKEFADISDQFAYRKDMILQEISQAGITLSRVDAFAGRGGGTASISGGVYAVNDRMLEDVRSGRYVRHPANLGSQLARYFGDQYGKPAYVVNPPDTDEFQDLARVTGIAGVYRESKIHALNQKEIGIRYAAARGRRYEEMNLIICHIGGGISVTAHSHGRMVDSNDIAQGDGPMAPTRCGQLPVKDVINMCFSGKYTEKEMYDKMTKTGGLADHLGTADAREVERRIAGGDGYAKLIYDAMIYQTGKTAGSMAVVLNGEVDAVILTGGVAYDPYVVDRLKQMIGFLAPVEVMAGEFEMEALAAGAVRVLSGEEPVKTYDGCPVWDGFHFNCLDCPDVQDIIDKKYEGLLKKMKKTHKSP